MGYSVDSIRLRAVATYTALKAQIEASTLSVSAKAELVHQAAKVAALSAIISYQNLSVSTRASLLKAVTVTGEFVKFRWLLEELGSLEQLDFSIHKVTADDVLAVDAAATLVSKILADVVNNADFARVTFGKDTWENLHALDTTLALIEKARAEALYTEEAATHLIEKVRSETLSPLDEAYRSVNKLLESTPDVSDSQAARFIKSLADVIDAGDGLNNTVSTDDGEVAALDKPFYENVSYADTQVFEAQKGLSDSPITSEIVGNDLTKLLFETLELTDIIYFGREFGRTPADSETTTSDFNTATVHKISTDNADAQDFSELNFTKRINSTIAYGEFLLAVVTKRLNDPIITSEIKELTLDKTCGDILTISEQANAFLQNYVSGNYFATAYVGNSFVLA